MKYVWVIIVAFFLALSVGLAGEKAPSNQEKKSQELQDWEKEVLRQMQLLENLELLEKMDLIQDLHMLGVKVDGGE